MKILILSIARTGSNYVTSVLNQYSSNETKVLAEPFAVEIKNYHNQDTYVKTIVNNCKKTNNIICKTHFNQFSNINTQKYVSEFLNIPWFKIVLLRKDLFQCTFSHTVADMLDNFGNKKYMQKDLYLDENLFLIFLRDKIEIWKKIADYKRNTEIQKIVYFEDLTFEPEEDLSRLDLPFDLTYNNDKDCLYNIKTPYEKIHINNFEIIKEIFNDTMRDFSCIGLKFNHGNIEFDN